MLSALNRVRGLIYASQSLNASIHPHCCSLAWLRTKISFFKNLKPPSQTKMLSEIQFFSLAASLLWWFYSEICCSICADFIRSCSSFITHQFFLCIAIKLFDKVLLTSVKGKLCAQCVGVNTLIKTLCQHIYQYGKT